jgi:hypothetical protein
MSENTIFIKELVNEIKIIESSNDKNEFICNYNKVKKNISAIDEILKKENKKEDKIIKSKSIEELYEMLDLLNKESDNDIDAEKLRKMKIVLDIIEDKIQNVNLKIEKIK